MSNSQNRRLELVSKFIFQPAPSGFMIKREPKSRAFAANLQPERRP
jgi:hypothetical protein